METRAAYGVQGVQIRPETLTPRRNPKEWPVPTGDEIRAALAIAGWSQTEFARRIGVDDRTVRRWILEEEGKTIPFLAWSFLIARGGLAQMWNVD
ncbi:helix-turn-helix domain-containing protein [Stutzerimonas nitrititolerans]|uniref:helix-turn-helix domain-containing protein n=1 Tax=Stutzerimonas nitrititolerans TaxID=2482751 RepID=UPI0028AB7155|nr:helix-turn-helix transcriptional regulator [Stutzerimonas nitrititolerans]